MKVWPVGVVVILAFAGCQYHRQTQPVEQVGCDSEVVTVVDHVEAAGQVVHAWAAGEPDTASVADTTVGAITTLGTWAQAFQASARGEEQPESVSQWEAKAVAYEQASLASCLPCPAGAALPAGGAPRDVAAAAAAAAGWTGRDLEVAVAIAGGESGYDPNAYNGSNSNGTADHGLWQINSVHADLLASGDWRDPYANARMAHAVWERAGGSWAPWVAYTNGSYQQHLSAVSTRETTVLGCAPGTSGVQPAVFAPGKPGAWGGHENGKIPRAALAPIDGHPGHLLRADAAAALNRLLADYRVQTGRSIGVSSTYRPYERQVSLAKEKGLYKNGGLAAVPGTSNHGWGLAADLSLDSQALAWMRANAGRYGFKEDTPRETWHWAYYGTPALPPLEAG